MDAISKSISGKLKLYRKTHGLNQAQFAKLIDSADTTVATWERGIRKPSIETAVHIYEETGCDILSSLIYDIAKMKQ